MRNRSTRAQVDDAPVLRMQRIFRAHVQPWHFRRMTRNERVIVGQLLFSLLASYEGMNVSRFFFELKIELIFNTLFISFIYCVEQPVLPLILDDWQDDSESLIFWPISECHSRDIRPRFRRGDVICRSRSTMMNNKVTLFDITLQVSVPRFVISSRQSELLFILASRKKQHLWCSTWKKLHNYCVII